MCVVVVVAGGDFLFLNRRKVYCFSNIKEFILVSVIEMIILLRMVFGQRFSFRIDFQFQFYGPVHQTIEATLLSICYSSFLFISIVFIKQRAKKKKKVNVLFINNKSLLTEQQNHIKS